MSVDVKKIRRVNKMEAFSDGEVNIFNFAFVYKVLTKGEHSDFLAKLVSERFGPFDETDQVLLLDFSLHHLKMLRDCIDVVLLKNQRIIGSE